MHGKTSPIAHDGKGVFAGLSNPFTATRYHSLLVERASLPAELEVSAWTSEGEIMGLRHKSLRVEGVQFHPESILTEEGMALLDNWLGDGGCGARMSDEHATSLRSSAKSRAPRAPRPATIRAAFEAILSGAWTPAQIAGLVVALRMRGENAAIITAAVEAMRSAMIAVDHGLEATLDTCGTGGDGLGTLNVSTAAAVVVASLGVSVAKHGNRAVSSRSGSADVVEALGVPIDLPADRQAAVLRDAGIAFLFAPTHHPAMKHAARCDASSAFALSSICLARWPTLRARRISSSEPTTTRFVR